MGNAPIAGAAKIPMIVMIACLLALFAAYALLLRLLRTGVAFINDAVDVAVALLFYVFIVPPLWIWERSRRPMWRTLSPQQTEALRAWLKSQ